MEPKTEPAFAPRAGHPEEAARLSRELRIHPVTAHLLADRGIDDPVRARRFLHPGPRDLHDPGLFCDLPAALDRITEAIAQERRIAVYGDYDVDGVSATAVLTRTLAFLGAKVRPFIPHRIEDGFGLSGEALLRLREEGCELVVTVDNGTSRAGEIAMAEQAGMRVVVTDHHEPGPVAPACPLINPKRADSTYPFSGLAGCGVAFKVACALVERFGPSRIRAFEALLPDLLALVAIGTVADVVPLLDENRAFVATGLKALQATRQAGLRALLQVARCADRPVRPSDVAFRIGPRINAAGRLGSARLAFDLLSSEDPEQAADLARRLDAGNRERQRVERAQAEEAFALARATMDSRPAPALVLAREGWHPGVIGIVAARVAEFFHRPAALISIAGDEARGSARCFGTVALHTALEACTETLCTHGGHARAAGFTLRTDRIDAFREAFEAAVAAQKGSPAGPRLVDAELPIDAITLPLATEIESLQPFGMGNQEPLFCAFGVRAAGRPRRGGGGDKHLFFYAACQRTSVRAVAFNQASSQKLLTGPVDLAFHLRRGTGPERVEIHVREIAAS